MYSTNQLKSVAGSKDYVTLDIYFGTNSFEKHVLNLLNFSMMPNLTKKVNIQLNQLLKWHFILIDLQIRNPKIHNGVRFNNNFSAYVNMYVIS